jgi:hypothetical protein
VSGEQQKTAVLTSISWVRDQDRGAGLEEAVTAVVDAEKPTDHGGRQGQSVCRHQVGIGSCREHLVDQCVDELLNAGAEFVDSSHREFGEHHPAVDGMLGWIHLDE